MQPWFGISCLFLHSELLIWRMWQCIFLEAWPRDPGGTEHPLHPQPVSFPLQVFGFKVVHITYSPPPSSGCLQFSSASVFREWPWKGRMACVIETGLGAAHPCEKVERLWVCVKRRSSGDSWKLWIALSVSLLTQENQLKNISSQVDAS